MAYVVTRMMDWKSEITGKVTQKQCWLSSDMMMVTVLDRSSATVYPTKAAARKAASAAYRRGWKIAPA